MSYNRTYARNYRIKRIALGLCTRCGKPREEVNRQTCIGCRKVDMIKQRLRRPEGLCTRCGKVPVPGRGSCDACRVKSRSRWWSWNKNARAIVVAARIWVTTHEFSGNPHLSVAEKESADNRSRKALLNLMKIVKEKEAKRGRQ